MEISCRFFRKQIFLFQRRTICQPTFCGFSLCFSVTGLVDGERGELSYSSRNEPTMGQHPGVLQKFTTSQSVIHIAFITSGSDCLLGGLLYLKTHVLSSQGTNVRRIRLCSVVTHARCECSSSDVQPVRHLTEFSTALAMRLSGTTLPYHFSQLSQPVSHCIL